MNTLQNTRIALIGCGDIGCRLAATLLEQGAEVHGFRRTISALPAQVIPHALDVQQPESLAPLRNIAFDYVVITLSPNEMSDAAYQATYVEGLRNILAALNFSALRQLFWVSSTSVYGQSDGSDVDELSAAKPNRYAGIRQLEAEHLLKPLGDKACVIRFAGIYREGRHRLVEQIKAGMLSSKVDNDYITNRIHIADCVGILAHLLQRHANNMPLHRLYIGVDSSPVLYSELIQWLAAKLQVMLPSEGQEQTPRVGSKRCLNQRIIDSGYRFIYPTYREGFSSLIHSQA